MALHWWRKADHRKNSKHTERNRSLRQSRRARLTLERLEDRINPAPGLITTIEGINFNEDAANSGGLFHIPPDPIGAAGPSHVVSIVNTSIEWHTKAGVEQNSQRLGRNAGGSTVGSFFQPLNPANSLFDPKVVYDQVANRFVVVALEQTDLFDGDPSDTSRILLAVSDDSNPSGTWFFHAINSKINIGGIDRWADYPGFAVDAEAVYVTANMYRFGAFQTFGGARLWTVHKTGFYSGGAATVTLHDPQTAAGIGQASTLQPAHMYGTTPAGLGTFLVSAGWTSGATDFLSVIRVNNPVTSPTFSNQFINLGDIHNGVFGYPGAPQSGTAVLIDAGDIRSLNAVWRNNQLYATNTILPTSGPDAGTETAHWYRIDTTTLGSLTLADQGNIGAEDVAPGTRTFYPSVAVDSSGNVGIGFAASAPTIFPGAFYTGRAVGDPAGTVQSTGTLASGLAFYERRFGGANRWGDYSGIAIDPDNSTFWLFNEYALTQGTPGVGTGLGRWGTRWGSFTFAAAGSTQVLIDASGNLIVTDTAAGGKNDTLTISRNGGNVRVHDPSNTLAAGAGTTQVNPNTVEAPLAGITGNITVNTLGGSDLLTVNFSGGNPIPAGGLVYNGGAGAGSDRLVVTGGSATTITHTFTNASDGGVNLDSSLISYTGLEPVTDTMTAANRVFTFQGGVETILVADTGAAGDGISRIDSTLGELVDFAVPTASLKIITNGGDTTTINGFDGNFNTPNLIVEDASGTASTFNLGASNIIPNATSLTINGNAVFNLNGQNETINGLSGNGTVDNTAAGAAALAVGAGNATTTFSGVIGNSGGELSLTKVGSGVLTLSGANTYTGATTIDAGTLLVNGSVAASAVTAAAAGTLGGSGTVGAITSNGTVSPGTSPGILSGNGNATFTAGSVFRVELNGSTAGTGYDQLNVTGAADLSAGPTLNVTRGFDPSVGTAFTILTSSDALTGAFNGLADGTLLNVGGRTFQINYTETTATLTRVAAPATSFQVSAPPSSTAGDALSVTVTARDAVGNIADSYSGTVAFTSSDEGAGVVLPPDYTFTTADAGVRTFTNGVTLVTAGNQTVTVTDTVDGQTGSATILVTAAALHQFSISAPTSVAAGTSFSITVTAQDRFGNTVTGYRGTVRFTSSDAGATLPPNYTFTAADNGVHTLDGLVLFTEGEQTITVTDLDSTIFGMATITVEPPP